MEKAIARILMAIQNGETIGILGDFDADGVTGTALLSQGLDTLGTSIIPYLPHRLNEGHRQVRSEYCGNWWCNG